VAWKKELWMSEVRRMPNPARKGTWISAAVTVAAVVGIFLPGALGIDGMEGGFALSFLALFAALTGAVTTVVFWQRAAVVERLLAGQEVLAHWTYEEDEWAGYADEERRARIADHQAPFLVAAGWAVLFGALFWLLDREAGWVVALVMLGLIVLLAAVAFGGPYLGRLRRRHGLGEAWLAPTAVYWGTLLQWGRGDSRLEGVEWLEAEGDVPPRLCFAVSSLSRVGRQTYHLRVPVPRGREEEARTLVKRFVAR
jgi:hypothetical protein